MGMYGITEHGLDVYKGIDGKVKGTKPDGKISDEEILELAKTDPEKAFEIIKLLVEKSVNKKEVDALKQKLFDHFSGISNRQEQVKFFKAAVNAGIKILDYISPKDLKDLITTLKKEDNIPAREALVIIYKELGALDDKKIDGMKIEEKVALYQCLESGGATLKAAADKVKTKIQAEFIKMKPEDQARFINENIKELGAIYA